MSACLVLHARDPAYAPASFAELEQALRQVGLIGSIWDEEGQHRYLIGERFLQLSWNHLRRAKRSSAT